jgi:hypothetical protein
LLLRSGAERTVQSGLLLSASVSGAASCCSGLELKAAHHLLAKYC